MLMTILFTFLFFYGGKIETVEYQRVRNTEAATAPAAQLLCPYGLGRYYYCRMLKRRHTDQNEGAASHNLIRG